MTRLYMCFCLPFWITEIRGKFEFCTWNLNLFFFFFILFTFFLNGGNFKLHFTFVYILQTTNLVPPEADYRPGDFVVLREETSQDQAPIWRFDSKTLLQRFNVSGKDENGETLYKSANLFSGYIASNRQRYLSVAVKFVSSEGNSTVVKVIQSASSDQQKRSNP